MERVIAAYAAFCVEKSCIDAYLEIICNTVSNLNLCMSENRRKENHTLQLTKITLNSEQKNLEKNKENDMSKRSTSEINTMKLNNTSKGFEVATTPREELSQCLASSNGQKASFEANTDRQLQLSPNRYDKNMDGITEHDVNGNMEISKLEKTRSAEPKKQTSKISHSTPVKQQVKDYQLDLSGIEMQPGKQKIVFDKALSSNLGLIVGDISGSADLSIAEHYQMDLYSKEKHVETKYPGSNESTIEWSTFSTKPPTLDLADLESTKSTAEVQSESTELQSNSTSQSKTGNIVKDLERRHSREIEEMQIFYDTEIRKLQLEKDSLIRTQKIPSHATSLINFKYLEEIKSELERRCQQYELRNRQLTFKVDGLSRSCFESERRCRVLETDKTILQERCYKIDQEKRKSSGDLSKVQDMLSESLSSRQRLEDELLKLKRKEINAESKLNDSGYALKELREDLNCSRKSCDEKTDLIHKITAQRDEIQENLNEALHQISRLEDASSQRATEKNLFQKLLEEYEVLYSQHQRIRNLYNEAIKKLDGDSSEADMSERLGLKFERSNSSRKKWFKSPTSPSIREQDDPFSSEKETFSKDKRVNSAMQDTTAAKGIDNESLEEHRWRRGNRTVLNRNSTGSILSWEISTDVNNNESKDTLHREGKHRQADDSLYVEKDSWKSRSFPEDPSQVMKSPQLGKRSDKDGRNWIVHNLDGITRFDVVFSSPRQNESTLLDPQSEKKQIMKTQARDSSPFSHMQASANGLDGKSAEITSLERDLVKLSGEKNEIESQLRRLPSSGSGRSRKTNGEKQELLEDRLDEVTKCIGNIKMTLRRYKAL